MKCNRAKFERLMKMNFYNNRTLAAAMGVHETTISKLKMGKTTPHAETLKKLCETLKCTPADILED